MAINYYKFVHQEISWIMKTTETKFDAVKYMREQRDELSNKLSKMTKEEIVDYFNERKSEIKIKPCA